MKRHFLWVFVLKFLIIQAQGFGIHFGYNLGRMELSGPLAGELYRNHLTGFEGGLHGGLDYELILPQHFMLSLGMAFTQYGGQWHRSDTSYMMSLNYIELPFMIKYNIELSRLTSVFIKAGGLGGYAVKGRYGYWTEGMAASSDVILDYGYYPCRHEKLQILKLNFALKGGIGLKIDKYEGGLYYTYGIQNINLVPGGFARVGLITFIAGMRLGDMPY